MKADLGALKNKAVRNIIASARLMEAIQTIEEFMPPEEEQGRIIETSARALLPAKTKTRKRKLSPKMLRSMRRNAKIARAARMAKLRLKAVKVA